MTLNSSKLASLLCGLEEKTGKKGQEKKGWEWRRRVQRSTPFAIGQWQVKRSEELQWTGGSHRGELLRLVDTACYGQWQQQDRKKKWNAAHLRTLTFAVDGAKCCSCSCEQCQGSDQCVKGSSSSKWEQRQQQQYTQPVTPESKGHSGSSLAGWLTQARLAHSEFIRCW